MNDESYRKANVLKNFMVQWWYWVGIVNSMTFGFRGFLRVELSIEWFLALEIFGVTTWRLNAAIVCAWGCSEYFFIQTKHEFAGAWALLLWRLLSLNNCFHEKKIRSEAKMKARSILPQWIMMAIWCPVLFLHFLFCVMYWQLLIPWAPMYLWYVLEDV